MPVFSKQLQKKLQAYFEDKHGVSLSSDQVRTHLGTLAELHAIFSPHGGGEESDSDIPLHFLPEGVSES